MDLDPYVDSAWSDVVWCLDQLEAAGIPAVAQSCARSGRAGFLASTARWGSDIRALFDTEPAGRAHILHRLTDERERHLFLIAATYSARCGWALLDLAATAGISASYRPAPGFLLMQAAQVAEHLHDGFPTLWPFEDYPDPFE